MAVERRFSRETLAARVITPNVICAAVPLKGECVVKVYTRAEAQGSVLPGFSPETICGPGVGVTIRV